MTDGSKLQVGVLFGGRSGEHDVSLMSARSVISTLNPDKYAITEIGITKEGRWLVSRSPDVSALEALTNDQADSLSSAVVFADPSISGLHAARVDGAGQTLELFSNLDVIFPVLHGTFGEDGTLQGLLEMADMAYVGSGVLGSALAMDKGAFKEVMKAIGVPVLESTLVLRSEIQGNIEEVIQRCEAVAPYPLFTKPANMGSSVGVTKCRSRSDLVEGLLEAAQYDRRILVERGINGREVEVSVLGNDAAVASVPGEIVPHGDFYTYDSKYHDEQSQLLIPAPISTSLADDVREIAVKAYKAVDCAGLARVDFLLDRNTEDLYLNEINTIPGFTRISMYPKLWEASGLSYAELCDRLIELALERKSERDNTVREFKRGGSDV